jgi:GntP family gluconate:H+ symporter
MMTTHDAVLLLTVLGGVLLLIALIAWKPRMHPFLALLTVTIIVGLVAGLSVDKLGESIADGAGGTFGDVGLVVALGAMLGRLLAESGATDRISRVVVGNHTGMAIPWLVALAAFVIGIPMFFEVGLVILLPFIFSIAQRLRRAGRLRGSAFAWVIVPAIAALATMHGMVPPHPGPLTAIATLKANLGLSMVYGLIAAVPAIILAGPVYARFIAPRLDIQPDQALIDEFTTKDEDADRRPPVPLFTAFLCALSPVLLMLLRTIAELALPKGSSLVAVASFLGDPTIAMLVGVLLAVLLLGVGRGTRAAEVRSQLGASLKPVAGILMIIAAGGAFKQVLVDAQVGTAILHLVTGWSVSPLLLGWVVAALLSVSTGSATVGIVGASGLLAPVLAGDPDINGALLVVAIGSGSIFFNYANHAGFWLVKESFGMSMGQTFKTITMVQTIVGVVGLAAVMVMGMFPLPA